MMMTTGDYLKQTKFVVDVSDLDPDAKLVVWKHFWDYKKTNDLDCKIYNFNSDNYFSVYSKSYYRGNISRSREHPARFYGDALCDRTFKPILQTETVYRVLGLDSPEVIEIAGIKYRRIS